MILGIVGIVMVVSGMILDDLTFWFISDMYFIAFFALNAIVLYKAILFIRTLDNKNKN